MNVACFEAITSRYPSLRIAVLGDFCLDRYLEIDPHRRETSIETGLEVYNVINVRSQPGGAGTILNNLVSLGASEIIPIGFCGCDGEGYELLRALRERRGVRLDHFLQTPDRRTFTYCKPLLMKGGSAPRELNRLDTKNWSPTPAPVEEQVIAALHEVAEHCDAIIALDQVDVPETGVITAAVLRALGELTAARPNRLIIGDSRRGLRDWPSIILKMNETELAQLGRVPLGSSLDEIASAIGAWARERKHAVLVTLAQRGILGATAAGVIAHAGAHPVRGPIDIVGAGDAVMANLAMAHAAGAALPEALELAMAAASVVIHQLGTTGTASVSELRERTVPGD